MPGEHLLLCLFAECEFIVTHGRRQGWPIRFIGDLVEMTVQDYQGWPNFISDSL
jgi:hypothetical protein